MYSAAAAAPPRSPPETPPKATDGDEAGPSAPAPVLPSQPQQDQQQQTDGKEEEDSKMKDDGRDSPNDKNSGEPKIEPATAATAARPSPPRPVPYSSIPYSATFSNQLMNALLNPDGGRNTRDPTPDDDDEDKAGRGIQILPASADTAQPTNQPRRNRPLSAAAQAAARENRVHIHHIDQTGLPSVAAEELPLSLDDRRRVYNTPIAGVRVTHPGGWLEGGPGAGPILNTTTHPRAPAAAAAAPVPTPAEGAGAGAAGPGATGHTRSSSSARAALSSATSSAPTKEYLQTHNLRTARQLHAHVERETARTLDELRKRMRAREEVLDRNERLEREVEQLVAQREMERKVEDKMRSSKRARLQQPV